MQNHDADGQAAGTILAIFGPTGVKSESRPGDFRQTGALLRLVSDGHVDMKVLTSYAQWVVDFEITRTGQELRMAQLHRLAEEAAELARNSEHAFMAHEFLSGPKDEGEAIREEAPAFEAVFDYEFQENIHSPDEPAASKDGGMTAGTPDARARRAMQRHMAQLLMAYEGCINEAEISAFMTTHAHLLENLSDDQAKILSDMDGGEALVALARQAQESRVLDFWRSADQEAKVRIDAKAPTTVAILDAMEAAGRALAAGTDGADAIVRQASELLRSDLATQFAGYGSASEGGLSEVREHLLLIEAAVDQVSADFREGPLVAIRSLRQHLGAPASL